MLHLAALMDAFTLTNLLIVYSCRLGLMLTVCTG